MKSSFLFLFFTLFLSSLSANVLAQQVLAEPKSVDSRVAHIPLVFEPNQGQAQGDARFLSRGSKYTVLMGGDKTTLMLTPAADAGDPGTQRPPSVVTLELVRSNKLVSPEGKDLLPGKSNYYIGKKSTDWITGIPQYGRVTLKSIYAGIDLVYYGHDGQLEYDFVLSPGADPKLLSFRVTGADTIDLDDGGNLCLKVGGGTVELHKPTIYQEISGVRHEIGGEFNRRGDNEIGLAISEYDSAQPLVIDPVLSYSTLIGANNSTQVQGVAVDSSGNVYITGTTSATNYPTVKAFQSKNDGYSNLFVTKLNAAGDVILYSTYLGGSGFDNAGGIAVDSSGSAYVTGTTQSTNFPTTSGAFMTTCPGICNTPFVSKFLTDGSLAFSTYMGGSNSPAHAIAVDSAGEAYIAGDTASNDLPTTPGSFEPIFQGMQCTGCINAYVEKLNASGTGLVYSTYFGAVGYGGVPSTFGPGIAVDSAGSAYLVGNTTAIPVENPIQLSPVGAPFSPNAFITKFSPDGASLVFSTYFGGGYDYATGVAVDPLGNVHVTGTSSSCEFPLSLNAFSTDCGSQQVFVVTLNSTGSQILFSTFLRNGFSEGVAVDKAGNTYVTGIATSSNWPTLNPIESTSQEASPLSPFSSNSFVTELDRSGTPLFSTYLGATGGGSQTAGIALDGKGAIYVAGAGQGDFPLLHPIPSQVKQSTYYTFFVAKISPKNMPQFSLSPRQSPVLALRNVSSVPLTISAITASANFTVGGNCATTFAPGTGCTLILEGAADKKTSGTVTITSNAYAKPQKFVISKSPTGDSVGSILSIFPLYPQFPLQLIGTASPPQNVVISNSGLLPAAINSIQMIEPAAFAQTNDCPALLNAGSSCTISITHIAATQSDSAQLAIVADPGETRYTVFLNANGSNSALAMSTSSVDFGTQYVGAAPLGRMVNVYNTTPYTTSAPGISTSTEFAQTNTCTGALAPHAGCRASVTYSPVTNENATMGTLTASGLGPGGSQTVSLYGNGLIVSNLTVSPIPLALYANVDEAAASGVITVTNTSNSTVKLLGFNISSPFSQTNNCPATLAAASSCTVTVGFKASAVGVFNTTLSITNSGPNSPQVVPVVGNARAVFDFQSPQFSFGQQVLNTSVLGYAELVNNGGGGTVRVSKITVQGSDFQLTNNTCPKVYPPYLACGKLGITFTPSALGLRTGTITVVDSDPSSPHVATLQGIGVSAGQGALSVASLNFGTQSVGSTSSPQPVTLTNTGTGTLTLNGISTSSQFTAKNNCGSTLKAGASCTISVQFVPTLQGILDGSLTVQDNGLGSPHTAALTGIGQ